MKRFFEIFRQSDNRNIVRIFTFSTQLSIILGVSLKRRLSFENSSNEIPCSRSDETFTRRYSVSSFNPSAFFNRFVIRRAETRPETTQLKSGQEIAAVQTSTRWQRFLQAIRRSRATGSALGKQRASLLS